MGKSISVVLADSSDGFRQLLAELIDAEDDMCVVASVENGVEAAERVTRLQPDVLITDLLLRELEGLALIRGLKDEGKLPHTIIVTGFFNDRLAVQAGELGVESFFPKPCRVRGLIDCIRECVSGGKDKADKITDARAKALRAERERLLEAAVINSGVMPHLQGFQYLREALTIVSEDNGKLVGITKILYPELARYFGNNAKNVERSIRSAINRAWRDGDREKREDYFGPEMAPRIKARPSNLRYLRFVVEFVEAQMSAAQKDT